jgi:RNA polymerase sigma-70 factor (ECF subfamily)
VREPREPDGRSAGTRAAAGGSGAVPERDTAEDFYAATYPRLVALLALATGSRAGAEEAVQAAFVRLIPRWDAVSRYEDPEAWVRAAAFRQARRRRPTGPPGATARPARAASGDPARAAAADPGDADAAYAGRLLARLSREQREVLVAHHALGLPVERVAEELDVPAATVAGRLARARAAAGLAAAAPPGDLERVLRDAVAREALATVTPPFDTLAFRGRHRRLRQVTVGGIGAACVAAAVLAVALPGGGVGPAPVAPTATERIVGPTARRPFAALADDPVARELVGECMTAVGYAVPARLWGLGEPLPPSEPRLTPPELATFGIDYVGCLRAAGYRPPPASVPVPEAATCDELWGRVPYGSELPAGGPEPYRLRVLWTARGGLCLGLETEGTEIARAVEPPYPGGAPTVRLAPLTAEPDGPWLAYGWVPEGVERVEVLAGDGTYAAPVESLRTVPDLRPFAVRLPVGVAPENVSLRYYDGDGRPLY